MKILIPNLCIPNTYVHDLAFALEEIGHEVIWGDDNLFYSRSQPDVILSQWPEGYLTDSIMRIGDLKKIEFHHLNALQEKLQIVRQKTLILAFIHNLKPRPTGDRYLDNKLKKLFEISYDAAHGFVHLGQKSISALENYYPLYIQKNKPSLVISQGLHELLKSTCKITKDRSDKNNNFRIFVPGAIRYWSELSFLIRAFIKARIPNKQLVIAGGGSICDGKHPKKLLRRIIIRSIPNVSLFGYRLGDQELCGEVMTANIIVAPRLWATNSAIPYLAATFNKRCIAPKIGNIPEALKQLNGILFEPDNLFSLTKAMEIGYEQDNLAFVPNPPCPSWPEIAQQLENFILKSKNSF
jgi:hypothetical protein